jgi:hypothetical protein
VADLASVPMMTKADSAGLLGRHRHRPRLNRDRAERILAEQEWYSYTPDGYQVFSSGGLQRGSAVLRLEWQFFVSAACLAWRKQARRSGASHSRSDAPCGAGGGHATACQHAAVRRADRRGMEPSSSRRARRSTRCCAR